MRTKNTNNKHQGNTKSRLSMTFWKLGVAQKINRLSNVCDQDGQQLSTNSMRECE